MNFYFESQHIDENSDIAKEILKKSSGYKIFLFHGSMGVGKTTLIKELSLQLGVLDVVSSPTFSIVNPYSTINNGMIYHFDFYRLESEEEVFDIGIEEYFLGNNYCFIEWPDRLPDLIERQSVDIKMYLNGKKRVIEMII